MKQKKQASVRYRDLMVGDYVNLSEKTQYPMYVTSVGEDYCYLSFDGNEGDPFDGIEGEMTPIETTEELLLSIGFKDILIAPDCDGVASEYRMTLGDYYVTVWGSRREWCCQIDNAKRISVGGFDFRHLHELQNGVRLITKNDIDIKFDNHGKENG